MAQPSFLKQIANIQAAIKDAVEDGIGIPAMRKIAKDAAEEIKLRTRLGYGVTRGGAPKQPLKPLASSTIENRKRAKIAGRLSQLTTPTRSNLTETGQMLDSLVGDSPAAGKAIVRLKGTREGGLSNEKLAGFHQSGTGNMPARPFLALTDLQIKRITDSLRQDLIKRVNKSLTKLT